MIDFLYQTGWGAFSVLLFFQIPFLIGFLYIVFSKAFGNRAPSKSSQKSFSRVEGVWLAVVVILFLAFNIVSIQYIPAISSAKAARSGLTIENVDVEASSWSYNISKQEVAVGQSVRFSAKSTDTVHGFAVYHPNGNVIFTMMLIPGVQPSS
ncbi:MAG: hypothetical protein GY771_03230, partial [bacterium]|nr:hypothetical protein [bacterium]